MGLVDSNFSSFNGAATFQSRKQVKGVDPLLHAPQLQWGRDLSVAETWNLETGEYEQVKLQWGRDLSVAETR